MRSHPAKHGEGFDAPPTIKRSGSEHRRAVFLFFPEGKCLRNEVFYLIPWCLRQKVVSLQHSLI